MHSTLSTHMHAWTTPMQILGSAQEVEEAVEWVKESLDLTGKPGERANLFETTIRIVGGLLSAAHLRGNGHDLLMPAVEIAVRLLSAFNTPSGVPLSDVNLEEASAQHPAWTTASSLSEVSTLSMEFSHVARVRCCVPVLGHARLVLGPTSLLAVHLWNHLLQTPRALKLVPKQVPGGRR
jgi:hypothetical protein